MTTTNDQSPHLTVARTPLLAAAKRLRKATTDRRLKSGELMLRYSDGDLIFEIPGAAEGVPAQGHWPGLLRVSGTVLLMLAKGELSGDPLEFRVEEQHLRLRAGRASLRFAAHWADISPPTTTDIPLDITDLDLLCMAAGQSSQYPPAVVIASGLEADFAGAEKRLKDAINRAHKALQAYKIPRRDFEAAVRALVLKINPP